MIDYNLNLIFGKNLKATNKRKIKIKIKDTPPAEKYQNAWKLIIGIAIILLILNFLSTDKTFTSNRNNIKEVKNKNKIIRRILALPSINKFESNEPPLKNPSGKI